MKFDGSSQRFVNHGFRFGTGERGRRQQQHGRQTPRFWRAGIGLLFLIGIGCFTLQADDTVGKANNVPNKKPPVPRKDQMTGNASEFKKMEASSDEMADSTEGKRPPKVIKTNAEWKKILKPEQYRVARLGETEVAFSNKYWNNKKHGKYQCVCCGEELYRSDEKFDSGTGWPSFWSAASPHAIATHQDYSNNTVRTEVHCDRCGAHLGHVFDDGPQPTGMRHCINSASLKFVPAETSKTK